MKTETRRPTIVAFTGLAQSGKTTAAKFLLSEGYERMSFADPIKQMVRCLTPLADKHATPPAFGGKTIRELYQTLGTDWGRNMVNTNLWVNLGRERLESLLGDVADNIIRGVVIDDLRFDNEAELVRSLGGLVIQIERPGLQAMAHASEAGVSPELVTCILSNAKGYDDFRDSVRWVCGLAS